MLLIRPGCGIHVVWFGTGAAGVTDVRFAYAAWALQTKLTGNTVQMVLSWLMPYFASARRPDRERTPKRHCAHTTWMWHPQPSVRAAPE